MYEKAEYFESRMSKDCHKTAPRISRNNDLPRSILGENALGILKFWGIARVFIWKCTRSHKMHKRKSPAVNRANSLLATSETNLLIERSSNVNSASNCTTNHRVVTDAEGHSCELSVRVHTPHSVGHISNGYRPYAARPGVSHWRSIPYEAILCRNPGRNLPEIRHTIALKVLWKCLWLNDLPLVLSRLGAVEG